MNVVLEGGLEISCFQTLSQDFLQEFLYLHRIPPNSSGFLFPPKAV